MADNARRIVEEKFSWEAIAHRFILMYMRFAYFPKVKNHNGFKHKQLKIG